MKLLLDENLSPRLVQALQSLYPGSVHAREVGLETAGDEAVWAYAAANDLIIVSKDADFLQRSLLFGHPPKVIWIRRGNCSTAEIESLLRDHHYEVRAFNDDKITAFLAIG